MAASSTTDTSAATLSQDIGGLNVRSYQIPAASRSDFLQQISTPTPSTSSRTLSTSSPTPTIHPSAPKKPPNYIYPPGCVIYPPIPIEPRVNRYWLYGWHLDPTLISAWTAHLFPGRPKDNYATSDPCGIMVRYSGYQALFPACAVPEDVPDPPEGVNYHECDAWALSSNYSPQRYFTRPTQTQLKRMVDILGEPYWFLDGLGNPAVHYGTYYI